MNLFEMIAKMKQARQQAGPTQPVQPVDPSLLSPEKLASLESVREENSEGKRLWNQGTSDHPERSLQTIYEAAAESDAEQKRNREDDAKRRALQMLANQ